MSRKEKRTDEGVYMERGGGRVQGQEKEQRRARSPGGGRPVGTSPVGPRRPATRHHLIDRFDLVHHSRFVFTSLLVLSRILLARRSPCERASSLAVLSPRSSQHSTAHTRLRLPEMSRALGLASVSFLPSNRLASPTGHPVQCPLPSPTSEVRRLCCLLSYYARNVPPTPSTSPRRKSVCKPRTAWRATQL